MSANRWFRTCRTYIRHNPRLCRLGLAAIISCGVCCGLPLVAVAGIGGGAAGVFAGVLSPGMELVVGAGVFLSVWGALSLRARLRRAATCDCGPACPVGRRLPEERAR
jgi:hypothetical protein